jgi:hypothetical protein
MFEPLRLGKQVDTMDRHETKARIDAQIAEWQRNLETMRAKAEASAGDVKVNYLKAVSEYQAQLDALKVQAARTWDVADDSWDSASKDLGIKWDEWQLRAKKAWNDLSR